MAQIIKGNYNALMWLQDELQQSLSHALNAINSYIEGETPDKNLSDCIEALYQVKGTLDMVNMSGAAMLTDAMQQTAIALRNNKATDRDAAQDALVRALLLLPNYLRLLGNDFHDHPLSLLDTINELRTASGNTELTERDIFKVVLTVALPDSIAPNPHRKSPSITIEKSKLGHAFQVMLVSWLRQQDKDSLRKMRSMLHYLRLTSQQEKTTLFWWTAETLLEALEQEGISPNPEIKQLLGKLVVPIKTQSEQEETALLDELPTQLITTLLLTIARAESNGPHVTLLKTTFDLHFYDNKPKIYGMSDNALGDANMALLEQLQGLKEKINEYSRDQVLNSDSMDEVIQQLQSMTDTLALLAEYEASNLLHHQVERLESIFDAGDRPDEETLTELADVLLQVEMFIQASTQANVNDQLRYSVMNECLLEMANIKEALTLMSHSGRYPDGLGDSEAQLKLIAGSLNMLNYPDASEIIEQTADKMAQQTASNEPFTPAKLNRLADILACCDIYMEGIKQHGHAQTDYLVDARDKLDSYDLADDEPETMIDVATSATETATEPEHEHEHEQALAEIDSILSNDTDLLFEPTESQSETPGPEPEQASAASISESDVTTGEAFEASVAAAENIAMPAEADWQFAEGIDEEIAAIFIEEANEVLAALHQLMPQWISHNDQDALTDIRRYFHTLKGSGRMAGAEVIGELAWAVEQVLNHVIDGTRPDSAAVKELASRSQQLVPSLLARFAQAQNDTTPEVASLLTLKQQCLATDTETVVNEPAAPDQASIDTNTASDNATENDPIEFDLAQYTDGAELIIASDEADTSSSAFAIDTDVLTKVEQYIQRQEALENSADEIDLPATDNRLSGVENYLQRQLQTEAGISDKLTAPAVSTITRVEAYIQKMESETGVARYLRMQTTADDRLSGVENYIQGKLEAETGISDELPAPNATISGVEAYIQTMEKETGVARYLRMQTTDNATVEVSAQTSVESTPRHISFTSVDRYLLNQARQQAPATSVERYLEAKAHNTVSSDEVSGLEPALTEEQELLQIFVSEAKQHIATLQQGLEAIAFSRQIDKTLLRAVHSLKGCANVAGITPMALTATDLDKAMKRLHAQNVVLDAEKMVLLDTSITGLHQILLSLTEGNAEPDIKQLADIIYQLKPAESDTAAAPVIDPEFLVVLLEETDELLDDYQKQLSHWQQQADDQQNLQALCLTLDKLHDAAVQAEQSIIADLYQGLKQLIQNCQPQEQGLNALLEQGYEQLSEHIESLLQNKPLSTDNFADNVKHFLQQRAATETVEHSNAAATEVSAQQAASIDLDEEAFAIPPDLDPELLEAFTEEAEELLTSSGQAIKGWLTDKQGEQDSLQLQRDLHTLKGGARLAGITPIADLTHQTETLVLAVSDHKRNADEDFFDLLQRCQDKLTEMQEQLRDRTAVTTAFSLIAEVSMLIAGEEIEVDDRSIPEPTKVQPAPIVLPEIEQTVATSTPAHVEQVRVRADLLDYLTNFAGEVSISRDRVTQQHSAMRHQLHEMEVTVSRLHEQLRKLEIETETQILFRYEDEKHNADSDFDPLELDRFSMIQQLSRSLTESVIDLNDISRSMDVLVKETDTILLQQSRLNTDLQEGLMNTRLLPFSGVVPRLERIVRQTSSELGKKAELSTYGADLELDRTILDRLVAPVEHILRNAIAHGVEDPESRLAAMKPESGQLSLRIEREGSEMVMTLSDDGRGIDVDRIRDKALSLNLIDADNIPSEDELIQLILTSGFSTADSISQLAGRGVGMDVVNNEIRSLKGRLSIRSVAGQGTTFVIRLPLTLSVVQALLVRIQDEQYAVPLGSVNAGERISVRDIKLLLGTHHPQYQFNGEQYDFMPLSSLLNKPLSLPDNLKQQLPILLFRSGDMRIALLVDAIVSNREIVIKSVGEQLSHITAINGATILGDGRVVFILDIPTLIETSQDVLLDSNNAINLERELEQIHDRLPVAMVVDDSITMRKASGNLLKRIGFDVMTARDGVDALSQLHEQKPDIILLDVEMPRMDGFEFASIVRNDSVFRHLPIIMITSRTGSKHRERAMSIGVNAYMGKPYQEDELVATMQRLLPNDLFLQQES